MAKQVITEAQSPSRVDALKRQAAALQEKGAKTIERRVVQAKEVAVVAKQKTSEIAGQAKKRSSEIVSDRGVQVAAVSALGGGVVVGAGGAATGFVAGGTIGAAIGFLPALFTFGLSIPIGAALGAGCGAAAGGAVGGATGFAGAGAIGYGAYIKRADLAALRLKVLAAAARAKNVASNTFHSVLLRKQQAVEKVRGVCMEAQKCVLRQAGLLRERCITLVGIAMDKSTKAKAKAVVIVSDKEVQATAASAAGGAAIVGAGGAATGLLAGGAVGAAVGVVPALFTFGLSIPFCAVVGSSIGVVAGSSVGGTAGAAAGVGARRVYLKRESIKTYISDISTKAVSSAKSFKAKVQRSAA